MFAHEHKVRMNDAAVCLGFTFNYSFFVVLNSKGRPADAIVFPNLCVSVTKRRNSAKKKQTTNPKNCCSDGLTRRTVLMQA